MLVKPAKGLRYRRLGGHGQCSEAEKTRSQKKARKRRRIPAVQCTLCWVRPCPKTPTGLTRIAILFTGAFAPNMASRFREKVRVGCLA